MPGPLKTIEDARPEYVTITGLTGTASTRVTADLKDAKKVGIALDISATGELRGIAFTSKPGKAHYLPWPEDVELIRKSLPLIPWQAAWIGHDLKPALRTLFQEFRNSVNSVEKSVPFFDTALAHAMVFPDLRHTLEYATESLLNYTPIPVETTTGQQDFLAAMESPDAHQLGARRAMERADLALQLHAVLVPLLKESGQEKVFYDIETPLLPVLAAMENEGIRLDPAALEEVGKKLRAEITRLEADIYRHAGGPFNIGSPKQLGELLFGKLALMKNAKKTKTGQYATDEATLVALAPLHPIVGQVLEHREASKLLSTYIVALPAAVSPRDGRIHTTFYQLATSTGRLNSQDPNLQNIPIRTTQGREIRRAFVPREGDYTLLSADYSQIELRILAALTQDPGLLEALTSGEDIHRATAAKVFGLPLAEVTKDQRNQAKMVNYGISYGISAFASRSGSAFRAPTRRTSSTVISRSIPASGIT